MKTLIERIGELEAIADGWCYADGDHNYPPGIWQCPRCIAVRCLNEVGETVSDAENYLARLETRKEIA